MRSCAAALLLTSLLLPLPARAQAPARVAGPTAQGSALVTTRVRSTAGTLPIGRAEMQAARRRSVAGGIGGFLVGGAAGAALACLANEDDYGVYCGGQNDTIVFLGAALGATIGAYLGSRLFGRGG